MVSELIRTRQWATDAGTARFARRHERGKRPDAYRRVARMRLSALGLELGIGSAGEAAGTPDTAAVTEAIIEAVRRGINVIHAPSGGAAQGWERCVGAAIDALEQMRECFRSELLISFELCGASPDRPGDGGSGGGWGPEFVAGALDRTLEALGRPTVDAYLVCAPALRLAAPGAPAFREQLRAVFEVLERAGDQGKLRAYGLAPQRGLARSAGHPGYPDLHQVVAIAAEVAGTRHRCRALKLPAPPARGRPDPTRAMLRSAAELGLVTFGRHKAPSDGGSRASAPPTLTPEGPDSLLLAAGDLARVRLGVRALEAATSGLE